MTSLIWDLKCWSPFKTLSAQVLFCKRARWGKCSLFYQAKKTWPRLLSRKLARCTISLKADTIPWSVSVCQVTWANFIPVSSQPRDSFCLLVSRFCSKISIVILLTDQLIFLSFSSEILIFNHEVSHGWYFSSFSKPYTE